MAKANKGDRKIILTDYWPNNLLIEIIDKHQCRYGLKHYHRWCVYEREHQQAIATNFENNVMTILNDIASTSERDVSIVLSHFRDGMTITQIADTYQISPMMVRTRISALIRRMRDFKYKRVIVEGIGTDDSKLVEGDVQ